MKKERSKLEKHEVSKVVHEISKGTVFILAFLFVFFLAISICLFFGGFFAKVTLIENMERTNLHEFIQTNGHNIFYWSKNNIPYSLQTALNVAVTGFAFSMIALFFLGALIAYFLKIFIARWDLKRKI